MVSVMVMVMVMVMVRLTAQELSVLALVLGLGLRVASSVGSQTRHYEPHLGRDIRVRFPIDQQTNEVPFLARCCLHNWRSTNLHTTGGMGTDQRVSGARGRRLLNVQPDLCSHHALIDICIRIHIG